MEKFKKITLFICISFIRIYRYCLSPLLGQRCRFYPSCSSYFQQALVDYGLFRGSLLGIKRLLKCHPWHCGGYDPVPKQKRVEK